MSNVQSLVRKRYLVEEIFTPTQPAKFNYIKREDLRFRLGTAFKTPGRQIIIYGQSGTGKSTLARFESVKLFNEVLISICNVNTKFDEILNGAIFNLNRYYVGNINKKSGGVIETKMDGLPVSGKFTIEDTEGHNRHGAPGPSDQRLAEFLKDKNCCWILDDFHKIPEEEKEKLINSFKVFVDVGAQIIVIGAVDSPKKVIEVNDELTHRVSELFVPLMTDLEIDLIIATGEEFLNISIEEQVKAEIKKLANGLAYVCHNICQILCRVCGIEKTCLQRTVITTKDFEEALTYYLADSSSILRLKYDKATATDEETDFNLPLEIIRTFVNNENREMEFNEICNKMDHFHNNDPEKKEELHNVLLGLKGLEKGELIKHDELNNKFCIDDPRFFSYAYVRLKEGL